jgi:hypothetical protein
MSTRIDVPQTALFADISMLDLSSAHEAMPGKVISPKWKTLRNIWFDSPPVMRVQALDSNIQKYPSSIVLCFLFSVALAPAASGPKKRQSSLPTCLTYLHNQFHGCDPSGNLIQLKKLDLFLGVPESRENMFETLSLEKREPSRLPLTGSPSADTEC